MEETGLELPFVSASSNLRSHPTNSVENLEEVSEADSQDIIRGTTASSTSKSTLMLLPASINMVTIHARLWILSLIAPTT